MLVVDDHASLQHWQDTLGTILDECSYCKGRAEPGIHLYYGPTLTEWHSGPCRGGNLDVAGSYTTSTGRHLLTHHRPGVNSSFGQNCYMLPVNIRQHWSNLNSPAHAPRLPHGDQTRREGVDQCDLDTSLVYPPRVMRVPTVDKSGS